MPQDEPGEIHFPPGTVSPEYDIGQKASPAVEGISASSEKTPLPEQGEHESAEAYQARLRIITDLEGRIPTEEAAVESFKKQIEELNRQLQEAQGALNEAEGDLAHSRNYLAGVRGAIKNSSR